MKVTLLTVGRTDVPWVRTGLDLYASRLGHYLKFELKEIPELKGVGSLSEEQIKTREGELILREAGFPAGAVGASATVGKGGSGQVGSPAGVGRPAGAPDIILLDERGREYRSVEFAAFLQERMNRGRDLLFVVGGAYGFSQAVYDRASGLISLSKMTFSHQMVRTIFAEQLYRACTILRGEPYHHE